MIENKTYCMSSFLMFRKVMGEYTFKAGVKIKDFKRLEGIDYVGNKEDLRSSIKKKLDKEIDSKTAIMLSGGIDSAILASFMPEGAIAYTLNNVADGATNEVLKASEFARINKLDLRIVDVYWDDYIKYAPILMKSKGAPIHSIEVQIYKAAMQAKKDGVNKLVFGESADSIFGGLDGLLSKEWTVDEFVARYSFVLPNKVLKSYNIIKEPYEKYSENGYMCTHEFISNIFFEESVASYINACNLADVQFIGPYTNMSLKGELDLDKVRSGNSKYIVRDLFKEIYPNIDMGKKTPMPRPMGIWLKNWEGPNRPEFLNLDMSKFTGDQKWLLFSLEMFLNMLEKH